MIDFPNTRFLRGGLRPVGLVVLTLLLLPTAVLAQVPGYRIQVGAQDDLSTASALQEAVAQQLNWEHGVYVVEAGGLFKVRVGDFVTRAEASGLLTRVRGMGYGDAWVSSDQVQVGTAAGGGGQPSVAPAPRQAPAPAAAPAPQPTEAPAAEPSRVENVVDALPDEPLTPEQREAAFPLVDDDAIRLDGHATERAWEQAGAGWAKRPASSRQNAPSASVQFAYDSRALYVATQVNHSDPRALAGAELDAPGDQERVVISIQRAGQTTASFGVTVGGARIDYDDARRDAESGWQARTAAEAASWSSEIRIPFELLNVQEGADQGWEVSVRWEDPKGAPAVSWMELPAAQFASVFGGGQMGDARFVIAPYYQASTAVATTAPVWGTPESRVGGDLKADLGEVFQAHAQVQPDYINTRPDPARVNLSPYETRFEEQRGFYRGLDADANAWAPEWGPSLFYSRRVGAVPAAAALPNSVETLLPTDVMGVAAFQGQANDISYRALASMTQSTQATILDTSGTPVAIDLSPQSFMGVGRVQHHMSEAATFGLTFTGVSRSMTTGNRLADLLMDQALTGTADVDLAVGSLGRVQAFAGLSHLMGSANALTALQQGSAHYFQRPDADHVSVDPTATALTGFAGGVAADLESSGVRFMSRAMARNPEYNIQDAGFMRTADRIEAEAWVGWGHRAGQDGGEPYGIEVGAYSDWNFGGVRLQTSPQARILAGANGWEGQATFRYNLEGLSADLTRGGPLMATPVGWMSTATVSKSGAMGGVRAHGEYATDDLGLQWTQGSVMGRMNIQEGVSVWVEPGYFSWTNPRQYLQAEVTGPAATFGQRYVFGTLDQTEFYGRVGLDLQLKYGLQLSGYAEPFVSAGAFTDFGELTAAQTSDLLVYGTNGTTITQGASGERDVDVGGTLFTIPNPDFNVRSFRSQVSVGWTPIDYATVTVAWLQQRSAFANQFGTAQIGSLLDSVQDFGTHLFVARVGYQLGLPFN